MLIYENAGNMMEYESFDFDIDIKEAMLKEIFEQPYIDKFYKNEYVRYKLDSNEIESYVLTVKKEKDSSIIYNKMFRQI